jgi:hypothetical protein
VTATPFIFFPGVSKFACAAHEQDVMRNVWRLRELGSKTETNDTIRNRIGIVQEVAKLK